MEDLETLRKEIDKINIELTKLLEKRFDLTNKVGEYKSENNISVENKNREKEILQSLPKGIYSQYINNIFETIFSQAKKEQEAIKKPALILIGMAGCGKTSFGKAISEELNIPFIDTDELIVSRETILQLFHTQGEKVFRDREKALISRLPKGILIGSGGGSVLDSDSVKHFKKIGKILYIKRSLEDLKNIDFSQRPLINSFEDLEKLYYERESIYENVADIVVENNTDFATVKDRIIEIWRKL